MKQSYDALLFDMDGVLVDVTKSYRKAIQQTANYFLKREVKISEVNEIKKKVGMNNDWDATYALISDKTIPYGKVKGIFQKIYWGDKNAKGLIDKETLLISKKQVLKLKSIYKKMGIATGRPRKEAQYVLNRFNLQKVFDVVVTKDDTKREKPFPDPLLKAMKDMGENKVVYIGDSPSDVIAATAAKIPSIYIGDQDIGTIRFQTVSQIIKYLL